VSIAQKIAATPEHGYTVVSLSGDRAKMYRFRGLALTMREDGIHVPIFFSAGVLTIHFPTSDIDNYEVFA
jgi:hypothetical protein